MISLKFPIRISNTFFILKLNTKLNYRQYAKRRRKSYRTLRNKNFLKKNLKFFRSSKSSSSDAVHQSEKMADKNVLINERKKNT